MKFFIFHCWGGDSRSCWSGWLEDQLRVLGPFWGKDFDVINPDFPETDNPKLNSWLATIRKCVPRFLAADDWVLVSHSLGGPTILNLLESFGPHERVKVLIMVAGFGKDLGIPQIENFVDHEFDWKKIKTKVDRFIIVNSDNDPYIPLEEGERLAKLLDAKLIIEHNAGHINEGSGFTTYPRLLGIIEKLAESSVSASAPKIGK